MTGIAASSISGLDSRAVAALLKELAKTGNVHRAQEFFDYVLGLGDQHEAARLCDVFTYTAAISICNNDQQVNIYRQHACIRQMLKCTLQVSTAPPQLQQHS